MEAQLFAATPPLEAFKCLLSRAMNRRASTAGRKLKLGFLDIKKARTQQVTCNMSCRID